MAPLFGAFLVKRTNTGKAVIVLCRLSHWHALFQCRQHGLACLLRSELPCRRSRGPAGVGAGVGAWAKEGVGSSRLSRSAESSGAWAGCPVIMSPDGPAWYGQRSRKVLPYRSMVICGGPHSWYKRGIYQLVCLLGMWQHFQAFQSRFRMMIFLWRNRMARQAEPIERRPIFRPTTEHGDFCALWQSCS